MPEGRVLGLGEKYRLVVTSCPGDATDSLGHIVNNVVVTMCGARWVLEILEEHFVKYMLYT